MLKIYHIKNEKKDSQKKKKDSVRASPQTQNKTFSHMFYTIIFL